MVQNPIRKAFTIPAAGVYSAPIEIGSYEIHVENAPAITDYSQAATLHLGNQTGDGVPLISRAVVRYKPGVNRMYIRGNGESAGSAVNLLFVPVCDLQITLPAL